MATAPQDATSPDDALSPEDRYLFDLQGYLVVPDALSPALLEELNAEVDRMVEEDTEPDMTTHRFVALVERAPIFRSILDNPPVLPYLQALLGAELRLDHDYCDVIRAGLGPIGAVLHGGAVPFRPAEYYSSAGGTLRSGLLVAAYNLHDVGPRDGGFACVPGSHKSAFAFPQDWKQLVDPHPCVARITGPAGSAIIFTEALTHGTLPWRGKRERRTLFYKYSPAPISWSRGYYDGREYPDLTDAQRAMLRAPSARPVAEYYEAEPSVMRDPLAELSVRGARATPR
jgi:hypothetical protein